MNYDFGYRPVINTEWVAEELRQIALNTVGAEHFAEAKATMGGEDFSYMLEQRPGAYIFVGNGDTAMVHHPAYNFDDDAIPAGSSWYAGMIEARMPAA